MVDIVITKAALYAQTSLIRGAIDAFGMFYFAIFDFQADLTADTAEGADGFHFFVEICAIAHLLIIQHTGGH